MGANNADFNGYTFLYSGAEGDHVITAHHPDYDESEGPLGAMIWSRGTGEVKDINVDEKHQRKGVATGMWKFARAVAKQSGYKILPPVHSPNQTPSGKKWAKSVGK